MASQNNKAIEKLGFRPIRKLQRFALWVGTEGDPSTGKSDFCFRNTPGPVGYINIDLGTDDIEDKFLSLGRDDVYIKDISLPAIRDAEKIQAAAKEVWNDVYNSTTPLLENGLIRTLCIDTADQLWEVLRLGLFGRVDRVPPQQYDEANAMMGSFLQAPQKHGIHIIATHRLKDVWEDEEYRDTKSGQLKKRSFRTGEKERRGFQHTKFIFRVEIRHLNRPKDGGGLEFGCKIIKCTANPDLVGLELWPSEMGVEAIDFPFLGQLVYPNSTEEDWR